MAEIEEELIIDVDPTYIKSVLNSHADKIIITGISLNDEQGATLAWLTGKAPGTTLKLKLKVKTQKEN